MRYRAVAFDWDGTLVDSVDHIVSSIKFAANEMELELLEIQRIKNIIGLGMNEAIESLYGVLSNKALEAFKCHYREAFFSVTVDKRNLFPNAENVLKSLSDQGLLLAVATGKSRNGLDKALQSTGLKEYFSIERCADESKSKPDPLMLNQVIDAFGIDAGEILMVGDTNFDMEMAKAAGVDRVGVSYGAQLSHQLEVFEPICIIDDLSELLSLV